MKLCKNQLVEKLAALLREADPTISLDEAFAQAKNQLSAEVKKVKRSDLEKLFNQQIQTLKDRGCPEQVIEALQEQKDKVLKKASEMNMGEGNIPFIPVIKPVYLGYHGLMAMVRNGNRQGYSYLNPNEIKDVIETPNNPYYIFDVENGEAMRGKSPQEAEKLLKKQSRSPLTAAEVINLCIQTDVLSRHYVDAAGSRCESGGEVPGVFLNDGGRPELDWNYAFSSSDRWGSASCLR